MHRFDYSFLHNGMLPAGLLNITADIYALRVMALDRKEQFANVFTELANIANGSFTATSNESRKNISDMILKNHNGL